MAKAITDVVSGRLGLKATASEAYNVPRSTLQRRIKIYRINSKLERSFDKSNLNELLLFLRFLFQAIYFLIFLCFILLIVGWEKFQPVFCSIPFSSKPGFKRKIW